MRTVVHVVYGKTLAGTERVVAELCSGLRDRGWRLVIVSTQGAPAARRLFGGADRFVPVPAGSLPGQVLGLRRVIAQERPAIVHVHGGAPMAVARIAKAGLGKRRVPLVASVHFTRLAHRQGRFRRLKSAVYARLLREVDRVLAASNAVATTFSEQFPEASNRVSVVHNGLGTDDGGAPGPPPSTGEPVILYIGRLSPEKNAAAVLRASANVAPPWRLVLVGSGPEAASLESEAASLAPGAVHFAGWQDSVERFLQSCSMLVVPNAEEGFGMVALEAMRAGRAVVGYSGGGLLDIVCEGQTGLLVEAGDEGELSRAIARLAAEPGLAARMGRAGYERWRAMFTADHMVTATEAIYRALITT